MILFVCCVVLFAVVQSIYLAKYPVSEDFGSSKFCGSGVNDFDSYYCGGDA